jgi:hypothetical protein
VTEHNRANTRYLIVAYAGPRYYFRDPGVSGYLCLPCRDALQHTPNYLAPSISSDEYGQRCYGCQIVLARESPLEDSAEVIRQARAERDAQIARAGQAGGDAVKRFGRALKRLADL